MHRIVEGRSFTPVITTKANKMQANYRIQTAEGKLKYTGGTEMGSWFFLEDARALVDYSKGEKIVKEIVFGVYAEIM